MIRAVSAGVFFHLLASGSIALGAQQPEMPMTGHLEARPPSPTGSVSSNYVLGPNDQVTLFVADLEEISNRPMRVDMRGELNIPYAGRVHAAGLTADQLEYQIETLLKRNLVDPHVVVNVTDFRSQPVSILGYVNTPGVHQLEGQKNLFEMLSMAGGMRPEAGYSVKIVRNLKYGKIPLSNAEIDPTGQFSVASVAVKGIMNGTNPADNIIIKPEDTITVPKADMVYVIGSVRRPGGYVMGEEQTVSVMQILSLAQGLEHTASGSKARILRLQAGESNRSEIALNINKLMEGKISDVKLQSDDILFVPSSTAKTVLFRTADAGTAIAQVAVYAAH